MTRESSALNEESISSRSCFQRINWSFHLFVQNFAHLPKRLTTPGHRQLATALSSSAAHHPNETTTPKNHALLSCNSKLPTRTTPPTAWIHANALRSSVVAKSPTASQTLMPTNGASHSNAMALARGYGDQDSGCGANPRGV